MSAARRILRSAMYLLLVILSLRSFAYVQAATHHGSVPALRPHQAVTNAADDDDGEDEDEDEDEGEDDDK